jgi:Secretion system C-terminal sorting domain/Cleaved Adhesin Domain
MKKLLLSMIILLGLNINAQTVLFEDSFEFETDFAITGVGDWTLLDVDLGLTYGFTGVTFLNTGVAKSFQVFNATATTPPLTPSATANWSARTGDRHMVCFASSQPAAAPLNNDWLISPQITLGTGNVLKFWAKACDATYFQERFTVNVSTTGTAAANFTKISAGTFITTPNITWVEYTYPLAATYNNLPVYIGINCKSPDMFGFAIDDFSVTGTVLATDNFFGQNFAVFPNPANDVINVLSKNATTITQIQITDINGRVVKNLADKLVTSEVNIADLTAGVYFVKVTSDLGSGTTKIVKQ